jgi:mycoredoxin
LKLISTYSPKTGNNKLAELYNNTPQEIIFYGVSWCGDCRRARQVFAGKNVKFVDVDIDQDAKADEFVKELNHGNRSVPTIVFPDGSHLTEPDSTTLAHKLDNFKQTA